MTANTLLTRPDRVREIVDDATRREFLAGLAAAGLLAACGADGNGNGGDVDAAAATRTFVDDAGRSVVVPDAPRRIVALRVRGLISRAM